MKKNIKPARLVLSTRNRGKIEEIRLGLAGFDIQVLTVDDYPEFPEVEETEPTLEGNASLKSEALFEHSGLPALADDTGLEVAALGGRPGVLSARFAGPDCSPADNRALLLEKLEGRRDRDARFRTVLAYTDRRGTRLFEGVCDGFILSEERGTGGFGYDAIFNPAGYAESFAELSIDRKNAISHRGLAVRSFCDFVATLSDTDVVVGR